MNPFGEVLQILAATPAIVLLILAGAVLVLAGDWRLLLTALLVEYVAAALTLTRMIRPELALLRVLVGALAVPILYLTARRIADTPPRRNNGYARRSLVPPASPTSHPDQAAVPAWGHWLWQIDWTAGPLGVPLRVLALVLVGLGIVHLFRTYPPSAVSSDLAFATYWLVGMGLLGLVLSEQPLRAGPALLTILIGFDLTFATLERSLAVYGFYGSLTLLTALALSYLAAVRGLGDVSEEEGPA
jgi:hypothetical protein